MIYQIKDWSVHFENDRSRARKHCSFVCVPNKQHGMGFSRIMAEPDGAAIYGIWQLLVGACSQQANRNGWLSSDGEQTGSAWGADDLALKFRRPSAEIQRALDFLSSEKVGWIVVTKNQGGTHRALTADSPSGHLEEKRREEKEQKEVKLVAALPFASEQFKTAWENWQQHLAEKRKKPTSKATQMQLKKLSDMGEFRAVAALNHSVANNYQGIYEPNAPKGQPQKPSRVGGNF